MAGPLVFLARGAEAEASSASNKQLLRLMAVLGRKGDRGAEPSRSTDTTYRATSTPADMVIAITDIKNTDIQSPIATPITPLVAQS